jgi:hypothetical protein
MNTSPHQEKKMNSDLRQLRGLCLRAVTHSAEVLPALPAEPAAMSMWQRRESQQLKQKQLEDAVETRADAKTALIPDYLRERGMRSGMRPASAAAQLLNMPNQPDIARRVWESALSNARGSAWNNAERMPYLRARAAVQDRRDAILQARGAALEAGKEPEATTLGQLPAVLKDWATLLAVPGATAAHDRFMERASLPVGAR